MSCFDSFYFFIYQLSEYSNNIKGSKSCVVLLPLLPLKNGI